MTFPSTHPAFARALVARGYTEATTVQIAVLQPEATGRDLLVSAQTGSGKTIAFGLAIAPTLLGSDERFAEMAEPLALIIAPTRELAMQVERELSWLYAETGARITTCVGGMDVRAEARQLGFGAHIIVGTPGRLRDHIERKRLDLSKLKSIVLDEADEMLDLGFREDLEFILEKTPDTRQTLLFSATMPREIETLARQFQRDAVRIATVRRDEQHADIEYRAIRVAAQDVQNAVVNVLRFHEARATLVFCATREAVKRMHAGLVERGFSAVALSGELTQAERTNALQALRDGRARVLVATDVAARGLDLPDLALVIHADLPNDKETLLHRSGRTGRAGKKGLCMLIVPYNRRRKAEVLIGAARLKVTWGPAPTAEEIRARDQERFLADAAFTETPSEEDLEAVRLLQSARTVEEIALALVRLHRARLPAPEDLAADTGPPPREDRPGAKGFKQREGYVRRVRDDLTEDTPPSRREDRPAAAKQAFKPRERHVRAAEGAGEKPAPRERRPSSSAAGGEMVWFRINIGRERDADPRWLLPLICRAGGVSKAEVGSIKIFDRDTRFQIVAEFADEFAESVRTNASKEGHIARVGPNTPAAATEAKPSDRKGHHAAEKAAAPKASEPSARPDAPRRDRGKLTIGTRPHRTGDRTGGGYQPRTKSPAPRPAGSEGPKSASKYAHKKKHRAGEPAKS